MPIVEVEDNDTLFSQYYSLFYVDPLNRFIYQSACIPQLFKKIYAAKAIGPRTVVYSFAKMPMPLIAIAQGFAVRSHWMQRRQNIHDDILPVWEIINKGCNICISEDITIYHRSFRDISQFYRKISRRTENALTHGFISRINLLPLSYKIRAILWPFYVMTIIGPLIESIGIAITTRRISALYHFPASVVLLFAITHGIITQKILRYLPTIVSK